MQANLTLVSRNSSGKEINTTISHINPVINSQKSVALAEAFNALTNNSYVETNRTDKFNCDTEESGYTPSPIPPTPTPTPLINPNLHVAVNTNSALDILYEGSGAVKVACTWDQGTSVYTGEVEDTIEGGKRYYNSAFTTEGNPDVTCAVYLESDDTYDASFATYGFGEE